METKDEIVVLSNEIEIINGVEVDWSKYNGKNTNKARSGYIGLCKELSKRGHNLVGLYIDTKTRIVIDYGCGHNQLNGIRVDTYKYGGGCKKCGHIKTGKKQTGELHTNYGKSLSEVVKNKISKSNKGKTFSDKTKIKMSKSKLGILNPMYGKIGELHPNFGKDKEFYGMYGIRGCNHPSWNFNRTKAERDLKRQYLEYEQWRISVYERDNYTCICCDGNTGGRLNAHHLDGYHWCKEKRTDINNGVTLCKDCHKEFHHQYGNRNNTKEQFEEFMKMKLEQAVA